MWTQTEKELYLLAENKPGFIQQGKLSSLEDDSRSNSKKQKKN